MTYHITLVDKTQIYAAKVSGTNWTPQLLMDGTKILSTAFDHLHNLDFLNFLSMSLKSMPNSFNLTCKTGH